MNNTFAFNRFMNLLANDGKMYFRNFGISLVVFCSMPLIFWLFDLLFGTTTHIVSRYSLIFMLAILAILLVPSKVYGKANLPNEGVGFAMMPASSLEKFLSMFFYCAIVTPLITFFGTFLVDTLLSILPFGGFEEALSIFSSYSLEDTLYDEPDGKKILDVINEVSLLDFIYAYSYIGMFLWSAIYMFGNMLFKKHKAAKTFACFLGIVWLLVMFFGLIIYHNTGNIERWGLTHNSPAQVLQAFHDLMMVVAVLGVIITALLLFFTYRKIKTQKY